MGLKFKKLEVRDLRDVETLITENVESIEPGLRIIDSSVLLGHARIDLVGLDAKDALVLIVLGFTGNDEMLLRVLDGYSWCLEYPDTIRRLYPKARTKVGRSTRPPRAIFIAESMPESFVRMVKQFVFPEVDCLRFLHLEVNGTAAAYFDAVERIRRPITSGAPEDETDDTPQALEQHAFIEGAPPLAPTITTSGNGTGPTGGGSTVTPKAAAQPSVAEPGPQVDASAGFDQYKGEWQDFLKQLGTEPPTADGGVGNSDGIAMRPEVIAPTSSLETMLHRDAWGALRASNESQEGRVEAHNDPETPGHPENGSLTREWREFLTQLKAAQ